MSVKKVITNNRVTAILDKKETNGGQVGNFSSHLWIDFRNVTNMELNITCKTSADTAYKELLPLGKCIIILFDLTSHAVLLQKTHSVLTKYMLLQPPWIPGLMDSLFTINGVTHIQNKYLSMKQKYMKATRSFIE